MCKSYIYLIHKIITVSEESPSLNMQGAYPLLIVEKKGQNIKLVGTR